MYLIFPYAAEVRLPPQRGSSVNTCPQTGMVLGLLQAFLLIGERGALRPVPPPRGRLCSPGPGGAFFVFFSVLFPIGVALGFWASFYESHVGNHLAQV